MKRGTANIHATCVRLGRAAAPFGGSPKSGVLILGESGSGKSDLALRLIAAGAELVADDRVDLFVRAGRLHARAPATIAGLIEVRGVGILEIPYTEQVQVTLAVRLTKSVPRLPPARLYVPPAALALARAARPPLIRVVAQEPSAPAKIAAAAAAFERRLFRDTVKPL